MFVYKTTCTINGKIYVGKQQRVYKDYLGSGLLLGYAIKKYGRENFTKEIIEHCKDKEHLSEREIYWINKLNSWNRDIGYNILKDSQFGNWLTNHPNREEIKARHRETRTGSFWSRNGDKNPMWGKKHSDTSLAIMRQRAKGRGKGETNPMARIVYQYDVEGNLIRKWEYAKECTDFYLAQGIHISRGNLSSTAKHNTHCEDNLKRVKNFIFSFEEINEEKFFSWKKKYNRKNCHK